VSTGETPAVDAPPGVSVLIATRDRLPLLRRALEAVWLQTYAGPLQVVVVFDGPLPDDLELPLPVLSNQTIETLTNQRSAGIAGARNTALAGARHRLVATCDDDDVWMPDRLAIQVDALERDPEAVAVGGSVRIVRRDQHVVRRAPRSRVRLADLLDDRIMELHPSAMLYRLDPLEAAGAWDETIPGGYAEDYDLLLRLARHGTLRLVDEVMADIHWEGASYFFNRWRMIADALTLLLERYPEFASSPSGRARIEGQIAFAHAAMGQRREAGAWIRRGWHDNPREPRLPLAGLVLSGVVSADRVQRVLHAQGRGI
jgi:glycosyltransferase involved in cell wall biosynthesis